MKKPTNPKQMQFDEFKGMILSLKDASNISDEWFKLGMRLERIEGPLHSAIHALMEAHFGPDGMGLIGWYCWENEFGTGSLQAEIDGMRICHTMESLYEVVMECKKRHDAGEAPLGRGKPT